MKKIFKSLLMSALALTAGAFVACTETGEEDNKKFEGMPEMEAVANADGVTLDGGVVEVTITSNAPWTAEVDVEDVTLSKSSGNGDAVVNVTVPAATAAREINVTFTAVGYMEGIELTATSKVSLFQNSAGKLTISNITPDVVGEGAEFSLKDVLVVAVGAEAYVIADETGSMLVYHKDSDRAVGEKININGQVTVYSNGKGSIGTPQFANTSVVEVVSTDNEVVNNPTVLDAAAFDALLNATVAQEVQVTGTWEVSGNYVNLVVDGATNKGSIKYIATADYASFNGQDVIIKGYFVGISASGNLRYINIMPYSVEADPNAPSLNVDKTELTFAATDGSSARQTFTATTNGLEGYELTWAIDNEADFTLGKQLGNPSRTTLYVTPKAANTGATKTATVTVTYSNGTKTLTKTVSVLQEGATANVYNLVTAAPADWSGEYIVGSIAAPSLWYMEKRSSTSYETTHCLRAELTAPAFNGTDKVETTDIIPTILVEKVAGTEFYSIKFNDEYLGWKTGVKNYFAFSATAPTAADTGFLWSFSIVDGLVKIDLQLMDGTKTRSLQYNSNSGQERFSVYTGTQNNVSLFALAK